MEEKATVTNKNEQIKSNMELMAIDELYYKIKAQQKINRCKSANTRNKNNRILNINRKNIQNNIAKKIKNNSIDLPLFTPQNSSIINKKTNTIDLTNILDSKVFDSTKQSTKNIRIFSGRSNSSYSIMNKTKIFENKKKIQKKNKSLSVIDINVNADKNYPIPNKNKTLKDLDIEKLMKKSKMIEFNKVKDDRNNEKNIQRAKVYDLMPSLLIFMKQKENNNEKNLLKKNGNTRPSHKKNKKITFNNNSNYSVKYNFLDNIVDNIEHIVNFVDIENREEIKQNVVIDNNYKKLKNEDFKTYGYEFDPEVIKRKYQDKKQKMIKEKYKELKKQILFENLQNVAFQKMMSPKTNKNYIPEYKKLINEMLNKKSYYKKNMIDKSTSTKELLKKTFKEKDKDKDKENENNITINEYLSNNSKKNLNKDLELLKKEKNESVKNKNLLNINTVKKKKKVNFKLNNKLDIDKKASKKKKKKVKNYNKVVSIVNVDNFFLKGNYVRKSQNDSYNNNNNNNYVITIESEKSFSNDNNNENSKIVSKNSSKNLNKKLLKKKSIVISFQKKKSMVIDNQNNNNNSSQLKNSKKDLQKINYNIIKANLINEEKNRKKYKKKSKNTFLLFNNKTRSSNEEDSEDKIDISFEEIERRIVQRNTNIQISSSVKKSKSKEKIVKINNNEKKEQNKNIKKVGEPPKSKQVEVKEKSKIVISGAIPKSSIKEEKIEEEYEEEDIIKLAKIDLRETLSKKKLSKECMNYFIQEHKYNSLNYLVNQKYEEIEKKNNENYKNNIDKEILENQRRFSSFQGINITSVEDIEYKKNVLLLKLKEDIKNKIKEGKCDINELENFKKFENNINDIQINYNSKDINKIKEYFLLLSTKFYEFQEQMNYRESQKFEEMRINKFIKNLNYELDFNIPRAIWEKGRRCHSSNLYKKLISLSEIKKK